MVGEEFLGTGQYTRKAPALSTYEALAGARGSPQGPGEALAGAGGEPGRAGTALAWAGSPGWAARQCPGRWCQYPTRTGSP